MNRQLKDLSLLISKCNLSEGGARFAAINLLQLMIKGIDLSPLAGNITKLIASQDIIVKKIVYSFIDRYEDKVNDLNLLATNTILKDLKDANPLIRGLAFKTIFKVPHLIDHEEAVLLNGLQDNSSYVRRIAVMCCCQLIKHSPNNSSNPELIDYLYGMIRDSDPGVVTNCLKALDEMLIAEGGIVINYNIAHYLLSRISTFHEWGISAILTVLQKYVPQKEEELFEIINYLDEYLAHNNPIIVIETVKVFLSLFNTKFVHLTKETLDYVFPRIRSYLTSSNNELLYLTLDFINEFIIYDSGIFNSNYKLFFTRFSDSVVVKIKKISILPLLATQNNISNIHEELIVHCTDNTPEIYKAAIESIIKLANMYPSCSVSSLQTLITLLDLQCESLTVDILCAFTSVDFHQNKEIIQHLFIAVSKYYKQVNDKSGKCAILWLIGKYGYSMPNIPYILESMCEQIEEEDALVKHAILSLAVKLFLHRPAEMQEILGFLLEKCHDDKDPWICDESHLYYSLLHNVSLSKKIVLGYNENN